MKVAVGFLQHCLVRRRTGTSVTTFFSTAPAASLSSWTCATRRHITTFKGQSREFLDEVNKEKVALVYFYAPWREPRNLVYVKLEAFLNKGRPAVRGGSEAKSSTSLASSSSTSSPSAAASPSKDAAAEGTLQPGALAADPKSRVDPEVLLKSVREFCVRARTNGRTVRIIPVNTDENPKLGALHDIRSVPTFVTYRDGRIVGRVEGFSEEQIEQLVKELLQEDSGDTPVTDQAKRNWKPNECGETKKEDKK
ncbi:thioredoxin, putative [Trypanosoma cruzi marinkellei]|uniref:Thioredoxin, putative n=1 Tax=Trypanosoma cruzi marinkellei TaxID=85056 RepID=K2NVP3_TRYCR|nr:thioredoxin, putative [Trypanosoma cruzi marinkellei]